MDYPIQYELYTTQEIIEIIAFLNAIENYPNHPKDTDKTQLSTLYQRYHSIVNNPLEEKKIDKMFQKQTGISIYKTLKSL